MNKELLNLMNFSATCFFCWLLVSSHAIQLNDMSFPERINYEAASFPDEWKFYNLAHEDLRQGKYNEALDKCKEILDKQKSNLLTLLTYKLTMVCYKKNH